MSKTARRRAASLAEIDLGPRRAAPDSEPAAEESADHADVEETLAKIAAIIRGMQGARPGKP